MPMILSQPTSNNNTRFPSQYINVCLCMPIYIQMYFRKSRSLLHIQQLHQFNLVWKYNYHFCRFQQHIIITDTVLLFRAFLTQGHSGEGARDVAVEVGNQLRHKSLRHFACMSLILEEIYVTDNEAHLQSIAPVFNLHCRCIFNLPIFCICVITQLI